MARWSDKLGNSVHFALDKVSEDTFLENFFTNRAFVPANEAEQKEFEDFSFISAAMALAVYVALVDEGISEGEKESILEEIMYQVVHNHHEYELLSEQLGIDDTGLVNELFENYTQEIDKNVFDLDNIIKLINKFYENNPYKKHYLLRFCYIVAFTESRDVEKELQKVEELAVKLQVEPEEKERLKKEARMQVK